MFALSHFLSFNLCNVWLWVLGVCIYSLRICGRWEVGVSTCNDLSNGYSAISNQFPVTGEPLLPFYLFS